jgi:2-isopropylmalate synthase
VLIDTRLGNKTWSTVGASTNIIEASWQALTDSMEYLVDKVIGEFARFILCEE